PRFTSLSFRTLHERLGPPGVKRMAGAGLQMDAFQMYWSCGEPGEQSCIAFINVGDKPGDLSAPARQFFAHAPLPTKGWTLNACPKHRDAFRDYPEQSD